MNKSILTIHKEAARTSCNTPGKAQLLPQVIYACFINCSGSCEGVYEQSGVSPVGRTQSPPSPSWHMQAFPNQSQQLTPLSPLRLLAPSRTHLLAQHQGRLGAPGAQHGARWAHFEVATFPQEQGPVIRSLVSRL